MTVRHRVFARMWGVAVLAHLAGNWRYGDVWPEPSLIGFVLAAIGVLGIVLILAPRRGVLMAISVLIPISVVLEAPVLGNHWLLAGLVSLAYLLTGGSWERFESVARMTLLAFYTFAAFAKLNSGFFDPATSCGVFYLNQAIGEVGLGPIRPFSPFGWVAAWGSSTVELAVPILLVVRRTRIWGVLLAIGFHGLLTLDLAQHFYDFTAVLFALFVLFLPDGFAERFERAGAQLTDRGRRLLSVFVVTVGGLVTLFNTTPLTEAGFTFLSRGSFLWWVPYMGLVGWAAFGLGRAPARLDWRGGWVGAVIVALVVVNGLTPYLEIKTAYGWNMYSNLVTVDGESNHFLIRSTWPLRDGHEGLVTIVESSDRGLGMYADEGYLLPWPSLRTYLAENPDVALTYRRGGGEPVVVPRAGDDPLLGDPVPWWWRWMPLRSINADTPAECQPVFLPAL